jgi:hypothetical protein
MSVSRSFVYQYRMFEAGQLASALGLVMKAIGADPNEASCHLRERLGDGTSFERRVGLHEIETICDVVKQPFILAKTTAEGDFALSIGPNSADTFQITIGAATIQILNGARATLERVLQLQESQESLYDPFSGDTDRRIAEALVPILKRVEQLEEALLAPSRRLRCFLSYRFTESNEIVALKIQQFLTLVNVEVLSGATYEPRQVSEKVLSRLREPLDLIILLITSNGESMWTRDEIGAAIHRGIALVPLVEKGAKFEPGLFADIEYVEFAAGHVGDAFLKLLQAVHFVREQKQTKVPSSEAGSP